MAGLAWTPDGESIVFASAGLWKVAANGGGIAAPTLIAGAEGETRYPSFSRSGPTGFPRLAYEYSVFDVNIWRWERRADGSQKTYRLPGSAVWDDLPAFSSDSRRIAFVSNRTGKIQIWTANADGSDSKQITFERFPSTTPQWSPDGQQVVFSSEVDGNWDIYVMRADASETRRLTRDLSQEVNPSWSRDGGWIYFRSDRSGVNQIWKVRAEGGAAVQVTSGQGSEGFESPDGKRLYFVRHDNAPGLWSVPVGGGQETSILAEVEQHLWGVADDGIAFVAQSSANSPKAAIKFMSFANGEISTGFSDQVELGRIGEIQQSSSVVMHIQIDGDERGRGARRLGRESVSARGRHDCCRTGGKK
jgi:WD40 repeat protein